MRIDFESFHPEPSSEAAHSLPDQDTGWLSAQYTETAHVEQYSAKPYIWMAHFDNADDCHIESRTTGYERFRVGLGLEIPYLLYYCSGIQIVVFDFDQICMARNTCFGVLW